MIATWTRNMNVSCHMTGFTIVDTIMNKKQQSHAKRPKPKNVSEQTNVLTRYDKLNPGNMHTTTADQSENFFACHFFPWMFLPKCNTMTGSCELANVLH